MSQGQPEKIEDTLTDALAQCVIEEPPEALTFLAGQLLDVASSRRNTTTEQAKALLVARTWLGVSFQSAAVAAEAEATRGHAQRLAAEEVGGEGVGLVRFDVTPLAQAASQASRFAEVTAHAAVVTAEAAKAAGVAEAVACTCASHVTLKAGSPRASTAESIGSTALEEEADLRRIAQAVGAIESMTGRVAEARALVAAETTRMQAQVL